MLMKTVISSLTFNVFREIGMKSAIKRSTIPDTWALEANVNKLFV